ncbi:MAG: 50S ribosomal protein L21 [Alphaproteobacteria bacterium]|nr:50S ribosomal protein L21 [Alphaproteobacteria bacterium]
MFAVVKTGGKQYRVSPGDVVLVEKIEGEAGQSIHLDHVLMFGDADKATVGAPLVDKALVHAVIREQTRGDKIIVFKKRRRQGYRRKAGHRQDLTVLEIGGIEVGGKLVASAEVKAKVKAEKPAKAETPAEVEAPAKKAAPKKTAEKKAEVAPAEDKPAKKTTTRAKKTEQASE